MSLCVMPGTMLRPDGTKHGTRGFQPSQTNTDLATIGVYWRSSVVSAHRAIENAIALRSIPYSWDDPIRRGNLCQRFSPVCGPASDRQVHPAVVRRRGGRVERLLAV